ncbi:hypothetical protein INS49_002546 [Diaporthe citri]|uniref:uncharacterized protein n=1 Tax=Diaporthe citri TaxID=83186 RepID=UPI001C8173FD|nr:uncharacterized protein INS49_002546 [Diaporthe citri]KAG6368341.1 hypothetical protein INS49_002546 [Diaporthe citri]
MAQQPLPSPGTETNDALDLASQAVASMNTQGSGPIPNSRCIPAYPISRKSFNQPRAVPPMMPLPSHNASTALPYHGAPQKGMISAQPGVAARQSPDPAEQGGSHNEPEVEIARENEQQDVETPRETEPVTADAAIAETQDEVSSDSLSDADVSDGPESRISAESEDDLDRADKYAFSYGGQAYDHRVPQHLTGGTILFANKVTQGITILQHLESAEGNVCPKLIPHDQEMRKTFKAVECIWVGMLPKPQSSHEHAASTSAQPESRADAASPAAQDGGDDAAEPQLDGTSKAPKKVQKRVKKCQPIIDLEDDQLEIVPHAPNALRVVAKKQTKTLKTWHLYALTTSENNSKLCQGWKVQSDEVFFFKAFRDDTAPGAMKRKQASDVKIKAVIFPPHATPALVPQSPPPDERSASHVSAPATPTPGGLPSPKPSGGKGKAGRTMRDVTAKATSKAGDVLGQDGDDAGSPVGSVEDDSGPEADNQLTAGQGPKEVSTARLETTQPERNGAVYDDGDEDAYPEHAVSATSDSYKNFLDEMVREFSGIESIVAKRGEKRKRVAFETGCDEVANTRRKTGDLSRSNVDARGSLEREGSASFVVQQHTGHLVRKLTSMIDKMAANQDVAGLRQCVTMVESIEKRGCPGPTSALAPYLNITSKKDATPRACCGKLREILNLFPNLENVDVDNHVLTCMISGLRLTGQSIDIGLIEPCIKSFSRLYVQKFGETANHPTTMAKADLLNMICQARDDAETMVKKTPLNSESKIVHGESKKP